MKKLRYEVICLVAPLSKYQTSDCATDMHCSGEDGSKLQTIVNAHSSFCTRFADFVFGAETSAKSPASFFFASFAANFGQFFII